MKPDTTANAVVREGVTAEGNSLLRYLHLDSLWLSTTGYMRYRLAATRCFFTGPSLGHPWDWDQSSSLYQVCSRCEKTWTGNL